MKVARHGILLSGRKAARNLLEHPRIISVDSLPVEAPICHGRESGVVAVLSLQRRLRRLDRRQSRGHDPGKRGNTRERGQGLDRGDSVRLGRLRIIAINNTLRLVQADDQVTNVIGPLDFDLEEVLKNQDLYRYLNVQ
jgi:hypothetical protein